MDIEEIAKALGGSHRRKSHKYWTPFAWAVRALVERGYGITESARAVLTRGGEEVNPKNIACVRVTYYKVKKLMWPNELAALRSGHVRGPTLAESPEKVNPRVQRILDGGAEDFEV